MSCARTAFLLAWATASAVTAAAADTAAAPRENADERPPILLTPPAPVVGPAPSAGIPTARAVSADTAAKIAGLAQKLETVAPKTESADPAAKSAEAPDLREIDKPRNAIIRLPSYLVQEEKPPVFKDRDLLTPKGRMEAGYQKHPGLHLGSFWIFRNDAIAVAMEAEEERLERKREFEDLVSLTSVGDPATHALVKTEVEQAFMHPARFGH